MFNYCTPKPLPDLQSETLPDGKRFYTTPDGVKLPSVTTVVGAQKKHIFVEWRKRVGDDVANKISGAATSRGTAMHTLCEDYLNNKKVVLKHPGAHEMFLSIKPALNRINNIHYQEQAFWSERLGMAGRCDCIAEFDGVLSSIDFKTSKKVKSHEDIEDYFWQTTAYALMYEEHIGVPIEQLVIIMAVEDGQPLIFVQKTSDHIDGLARAIKYYKDNTK